MADYIGPYRLLKVLMTGNTSQIWEVIDDRSRKTFALKTLQPDHVTDKEQVGYLKLEYEIGKTLEHKNIVQMHAFETHKGIPYLVMELYPVPNLKQHLTTQGYQQLAKQSKKILHTAADALAYFHRQGWVHRDIKPDNFLVDETGTSKMIDFALSQKKKSGLAKLFAGKSKIQGTMSYMSPEQIRGQAVDHRADEYSFGCMMYELLTGKPPFVAIGANELLQKHLTSPPLTMQAVDPNLTSQVCQLVERMLKKKPDDRPETMNHFLVEFKNVRIYKRDPK